MIYEKEYARMWSILQTYASQEKWGEVRYGGCLERKECVKAWAGNGEWRMLAAAKRVKLLCGRTIITGDTYLKSTSMHVGTQTLIIYRILCIF
jgi:hypothetical protein